ncbi:MAG: hypothetical protein MUC65_04960 [Pontiellaceae bacterium]|jgi:hypothetical protein|nr:hypothetical protein [Pontiellaceae bacterium]
MNKSPPFLISAALLFWGWQTNLLPLAILFSVAIEARRIIKTRWDLTRAEWSHLTDTCTIILLGILTAGFFRDKTRIMFDIGKLLPCIFFPLFAAQHYSLSGKVDLAALSLIARLQKKSSMTLPPVNLFYPYLLLSLIAAGFGNRTDGSYFAGICVLGGWTAYGFRSRQTPLYRWIVLILLAAGLGFSGHTALFELQKILTGMSRRFFEHSANPLKSITSLGDIGTQKMHDTILFRATPDTPAARPLLLREASYNVYRSPEWSAMGTRLNERPSTPADQPVRLSDPPEGSAPHSIHIHTRIRKGKDTLKLPGDTFQIDFLPRATLETNQFGAMVIKDVEKGLINYRASFSAGAAAESPPNKFDLEIPPDELNAITLFIDETGLKTLSSDAVIQTLKTAFNTQFRYTLNHKGKGSRQTPLANFLLDRKAGQCEYFATATVLILRACGIPARYTVGYVAAEYSPLERQFIIRQRHGHAWTRVFINGYWQDLDTTSPNWLELEDADQSIFHLFTDFGSFIAFQLSRFRWSETDYMSRLAIGLLILLILMISNRLRKQKETGRKKMSVKNKKQRPLRPANFDGFYRLEQALARKGYPRNPGETLITWAARIRQADAALLNYDDLRLIIQQHYRQRFAPDRVPESPSDQKAIDQLIESINPTRPGGNKKAGP